jgi:hypothetical protein
LIIYIICHLPLTVKKDLEDVLLVKSALQKKEADRPKNVQKEPANVQIVFATKSIKALNREDDLLQNMVENKK